MSPGDVDGRIRRELTDHADPLLGLDTSAALSEVLAGAARRRRRRQGALVATAAAVALGVVGLRGLVADSSEPQPVPATSLRGSYTRDVTDGDWQGRWTMTLRGSRELALRAPDSVPGAEAPTDGSSYRLTAGELAVDAFTNGACTELAPGTYTWSRRGTDVVLLPLDEPCAQREQVFAGVWRRSP